GMPRQRRPAIGGESQGIDGRFLIETALLQFLSALDLPLAHRMIDAAAGGNGALAVAQEGNALDHVAVPLPALAFLAGLRVPNDQGAALAPRQNGAAVRGEGEAADLDWRPLKSPQLRAVVEVKQLH